MAKSKDRGGSSGRLKKGGHKVQRGGLKHRRSKAFVKLSSTKESGLRTTAKAEQPTDRPMLGVEYQASAHERIYLMLVLASAVP